MTAPLPSPSFEEMLVQWARSRASHESGTASISEVVQHPRSRLSLLARMFGMELDETEALALTLADALDPSLQALWMQVEPRRGWPRLTTESAALVGESIDWGTWGPDRALLRWQMIDLHELEPGLPPAVSIDPCIREWLCGRRQTDQSLADVLSLPVPYEALPSWPVEESAGLLLRIWETDRGARVRCVIQGQPGSGRKAFAQAIAGTLGLPLFTVEAPVPDAGLWVRANRQAYLDGCALLWAQPPGAPPANLLPVRLQFVCATHDESPEPLPGIADLRFEVPPTSAAERLELWHKAVPEWPREAVHDLGTRHRSTPGEIAQVARQHPESPAVAARLLREASRGRLGNLADRIEAPFTFDDLIVGASVREPLEDLIFEASHRTTFWENEPSRRLFPQGRGLTGLFSGPPGTGKTMAAQVIAAALDLDLYRIDISAVVSKWVGETSRNLERILRTAADLDIVLLFDEADALFAKRSSEMRDAQDKFANMDAGHLLTAIENYPGVVILTTNLKTCIDHAFIRRMRFVVDFPKPDAAQRLQLWVRLTAGLGGSAAVQRLQPGLEIIAGEVEATGAQIKYAVLGGVFRARREDVPLGLAHLLHGLNRELSKEGRAISTRDMRRLCGEEV